MQASQSAAVPPSVKHQLEVAMAADEIEMLVRHLSRGATYLEFGSGGSTMLALERGVARCWSVESDPRWIETLRTQDAVQRAECEGRLVLHAVDIGPVMDWGMPANRSKLELWPNYFLPVWDRIGCAPDVVLIDGRFRAACGLAALLNCPTTTAILMHDFYDTLSIRKNYRRLLEVADIVEECKNLVSLRRKPEVTATNLLSRLSTAWCDFA